MIDVLKGSESTGVSEGSDELSDELSDEGSDELSDEGSESRCVHGCVVLSEGSDMLSEPERESTELDGLERELTTVLSDMLIEVLAMTPRDCSSFRRAIASSLSFAFKAYGTATNRVRVDSSVPFTLKAKYAVPSASEDSNVFTMG
jgi:hypothetical protein